MSRLEAITIGDSSLDTFLFIDPDEADIECNVRSHECEICFDLAEKIPVRDMCQYPGGNAANAAVGLSRLKIKTGSYSIIGHDETGDMLWNNFRREKVSLRYIRRQGKTNNSFIITLKGERNIFSYHEKRDYALPRLEPVKWLYITSMKNGFEEVFHSLMGYIHRVKPSVTYNPGSFQLRKGIYTSQALLRQTTLLVLNREEAAGWLEKPITTTIKELLSDYYKLGPKNVIITDGQKGSYGFDGKNYYHCPIYNKNRLEATGAGDSFASAATAAMFYNIPLNEAMRWGTINANSVVNHIGGQPGLMHLSDLKHELTKSADKLKTSPLTE